MEQQDTNDNRSGTYSDEQIVPDITIPLSDKRSSSEEFHELIDIDTPKHKWWNEFASAGADRHIELALGVLIASFAFFQLIASCNNSKSSTEQMNRLLAATDRINDAAKSFSASASNINRGIGNAVDKLNLQAGATRALAIAAGEQASQTEIVATAAKDQAATAHTLADVTQKQMTYSQRPWVGTDLKDTVISEVIDGKPIEWHVDFKNYGNSTALHVKLHTRIYLNIRTVPDWPTIQSNIEHLDLSQQMEFTLFAGQKLPNPGISNTSAPIGLKTQLDKGVSQVIVGGIVQYLDEFDATHTTTFCVGYNPPKDGIPAGWIACPIKPIAN